MTKGVGDALSQTQGKRANLAHATQTESRAGSSPGGNGGPLPNEGLGECQSCEKAADGMLTWHLTSDNTDSVTLCP